MRLEKSWIIVRKEFSEFRKNKYILYSLFLMPRLMAVVLPVVYLVPISTFATPPANHPLDLGINIVQEIRVEAKQTLVSRVFVSSTLIWRT
jgi:hypothetical protein